MRIAVLPGVLMMATASLPGLAAPEAADYPVHPVPFTDVRFTDGFWAPRVETNRRVTVPYDFAKCEETGRLGNFAKAAGQEEGDFRGTFFDDSDVYKVIEGAAYTLAVHPDPTLEAFLDNLIATIAAAQEEDGYLYTIRSIQPDRVQPACGPERWSNLIDSHELYNVGHMYEAAVAFYEATGKRTLLDVALKNAELIDRVFGPEPGKIRSVPGHEEIEIGLVRLYRTTGDRRWLNLAKFFIDGRGRAEGRNLFGPNRQDHIPLVEQSEAVGHAVRAGYLYAGAADVAALTGDGEYLAAVDRIWENVVGRKLAAHGGIGGTAHGEAFAAEYDLPNKTSYNETCAAIANALWNQRMFLLHGDAKYLDVLERTVYNGFLAGISLSGDRFFYPNLLAVNAGQASNHGSPRRAPWFGCSCCPVNIVRFIPALPGYAYAVREDSVYVNLFVGSTATVKVGGRTVELVQKTDYPWSGDVDIAVNPAAAGTFTLRVRIPGWAVNRPVPSDLYTYEGQTGGRVAIRVNGEAVTPPMESGFAVLNRSWRAGDTVRLELPMEVRRLRAHPAVEADRDRVAIERGPLLYCFEAVDNDGKAEDLVIGPDAVFTPEHRPDLLGGITVLTGTAARAVADENGVPSAVPATVTAVPYYAWAHREQGSMTAWPAATVACAEPRKPPTVASKSAVAASHCWEADSLAAINDQVEPTASGDHSLARFTWWDHCGTTEWVSYDFDQPTRVSEVDVYWFDDSGRGACRVPQNWKLFYRVGDSWREVPGADAYGVELDRFNTVRFTPVTAEGLRIEAELRPGVSGGILEWRVR